MTDRTPLKLIDLYQELYELTRPKCDLCPVPRSCCSPEYCGIAQQIAAERGVQLKGTGHPTLPFMGENGCIVPPHLRPLCTRHTCRMNSLGFEPGDPEFTYRWFDLVDKIDELEFEIK